MQIRPAELVYRLQTSDLLRQAFLTAPAPQLETCPDRGSVRVAERSASHTTLDVSLPCRGMVMLSDTWYPGWVATLDGVPSAIYEVDGAIRGVVAGAGSHRIEMRYRPRSVYAGGVLTGLGLLGALVLGIRTRGAAGASFPGRD